MSINTFNLFHSSVNGTKIELNKLNNTMAMLHPTKASSNFTSKSFTPVGMKSKGLSIRSQSDLNIGVTQSAQSSLKAGDAKKNLPTPHQDKVSKVIRKKQQQGLSPTSKSPHSLIRDKNKINENIFKKPLTPKLIIDKKVYPEPENLAGYYDYEDNYNQMLIGTRALDNEAKEFAAALRKPQKPIIPYEDDVVPPVPCIKQSPPSIIVSDDIVLSDVDLPTLSDDED
ncbi:uncharacterized protein LOC103577071 isoform X2 [Microplitis demolitor]|uniref:uncharacterized protein LOC103577071 isoform X2 n=1 Tax=Microplitis demolitor TaxID=69319 RepID=UPI00235B6C48|nr:uncharacterized protein LOC103577071 isoform X2 [Microplitis demolitor]